MQTKNEKALVLGGGYSGLLAAKVLSEFFKEVIVVERDQEQEANKIDSRQGAPQVGFAHLLVPFGLSFLEKIFPNYEEVFLQNGGRKIDLTEDMLLTDRGVDKPRFKSDFLAFAMSRALIDKSLRTLLMKSSNVSFIYNTEVKGFTYDYQKKRVSGASLRNRESEEQSNIYADLIVDAMGPRSEGVNWLEAFGIKRPPEEVVTIDYTQLAFRARWKMGDEPDWLYNILRFPDLKKGGYFMRIEDDAQGNSQWLFAVVAHFSPTIEKTRDAFDEVCSKLGSQILYEKVKNATQLTDVIQYKVPTIRRRFFSQMKEIPSDYIGIGDVQTIWAPHTGLGLAIATSEAKALQETLQSGGRINLAKRYYKASEKIVAKYWKEQITRGLIPIIGTPKSSLFVRALNGYKKKVAKYSSVDPKLWKAMVYFVLSEKPTISLFRPNLILRVLIHMMKGA